MFSNIISATNSVINLTSSFISATKIIHILMFVLICVAFCVTFYITYKTFKNN